MASAEAMPTSAAASSVSSFPSPPASSLPRSSPASAEEAAVVEQWAEVLAAQAVALVAAVLLARARPRLSQLQSRRRSG